MGCFQVAGGGSQNDEKKTNITLSPHHQTVFLAAN